MSVSHTLHETLLAIYYNLYNLKNVKNTDGGVLLLVKLQAEACANGIKSRNESHMKITKTDDYRKEILLASLNYFL